MPSFEILVTFLTTTFLFAYIPGPTLLYASAQTLLVAKSWIDGKFRITYRRILSCLCCRRWSLEKGLGKYFAWFWYASRASKNLEVFNVTFIHLPLCPKSANVVGAKLLTFSRPIQ